MELKKAKRSQVKIRMSVAAPTGFGKTIAALLIAFGITKDWDKIAVIDTENESASLYADHVIKKTNYHIGEFQTIPMQPPYTPEKFSEAIKICEDAGMEVIILDSITHVWKGEGGLLESNNQLGGSFQSWAKTTPRYQKWLNSILHSSAHIITTNRKKQGYNVITDGGKTKVEKVGMEDEIRDGYDYEMTVAFEIINNQHLCMASKDRTGLFSGIPEFVITEETGELIKDWCGKGISALPRVEVDQHPVDNSIQPPASGSDDKAAEIPQLPEITLKMFNQLLARLKMGESDVIDKAKVKYSFAAEKKTAINNVVKALKPDTAFAGDISPITEKEFREVFLAQFKKAGMPILVNARKFFTFTKEQEEWIEKTIASLKLDQKAA